MSAFKTLIYEKKEGIAYITLNRPRVLNALNLEMRDELFQVLPAVRDDPEVMVAILQGAGDRAFCAGADITEFGTAPSLVMAREARWARDLWGLFLKMEKPFIAAIHGYALGAGLEMALCCDLRIATEEARFGLPEVGLGMIPAAGGSQTLPRLIPPGKAAEFLLTGDMIGAPEAFRLGLLHKVVPRGNLLSAAQEMAWRIMSRAPLAIRCAKEAVNKGLDLSLEEGIGLERRLVAFLMRTEDAREGVRALLQRRAPHFKGY